MPLSHLSKALYGLFSENKFKQFDENILTLATYMFLVSSLANFSP